MTDQITVPRATWDAMRGALEKFIAKELTFGQRYTNEGQALLDALRVANDTAPYLRTLELKLPGGKLTDQWESARVADYNQGWNDYRKAAKASLTAANAVSDQDLPVGKCGVLSKSEPQAQGEALPLEGSEAADNAIHAILCERQWPSSSMNAARAGWRAARLFANPQAAEPAGYKLVPVELTTEMCDAARWSEYGEETRRKYEVSNEFIQFVWASLLAAGPEAKQ